MAWPEQAFARLGSTAPPTSPCSRPSEARRRRAPDRRPVRGGVRGCGQQARAGSAPRAAARRRTRRGAAERVAAPIGLDLGAVTPEETALSIMSEVVAVRNGGEAASLTFRRPDPRGGSVIGGLRSPRARARASVDAAAGGAGRQAAARARGARHDGDSGGRVVVVLGALVEEVTATVDLHGASPHVRALGRGPGRLAGVRARPAGGLRGRGGHARRPAAHVAGRDPAGDRRSRWGRRAVRATYNGTPGHPVLLEREIFESFRNVSGDHGARNLLLSVQVRDVPCEDLGGGEDVVTPAELHALRAGGPVTAAPAR